MRVILSGGGSAGHVNPALAIADIIKKKYPDAEIRYVGTEHGIENDLCKKAGIEIFHAPICGFSRSLSPKNFKTAYYMTTTPKKVMKMYREWKPDLVVGTGGYACWPALRAAQKMNIPTVAHESNALLGKALQWVIKDLDILLTNYDLTAQTKKAKKVIRVGNPIRRNFEELRKDTARERLGIGSEKKVVLVFGGSLGAPELNRVGLALAERFCADPEFLLWHSTGRAHFAEMTTRAAETGVNRLENYRMEEYLYDIPLRMAAADLLVCRAGAMTVSELAAMKKSAVLIPSPYVAEDHQYKNAKLLEDAGAVRLYRETKTSSESEDMPAGVCETVAYLLGHPEEREKMSEKIADFYDPSVEDKILDAVESLVGIPNVKNV